jgi:hypothetical protein
MNPAWRLTVLALTLGGCALAPTLSPDQQTGLERARAFLGRAAQVYGLWKPTIVVGPTAGEGAGYSRGVVSIRTSILASAHLEALLAHEAAHWVLGHEPFPFQTTRLDTERRMQEREREANVKAVEILIRVAGYSEETALEKTFDLLDAWRHATERGEEIVPWGHKPPCEEIADLFRAFPQHRQWSQALECAHAAR